MKLHPSPHKAHQKRPRSHQPVVQLRMSRNPSPVPPPRVHKSQPKIPLNIEKQPTTLATKHNYNLQRFSNKKYAQGTNHNYNLHSRTNQNYMQGYGNSCIHIATLDLCNAVYDDNSGKMLQFLHFIQKIQIFGIKALQMSLAGS